MTVTVAGSLLLGATVFPAAGASGQLPASDQPGEVQTEVALKGLDELITGAMRRCRVPGVAISIVKDGRVLLSRGYGVRVLGSSAPMTPDTIFPIQSETKAFTAFSAGLLVDEGRISLDEPVSTYIPGFRMHDPVASLHANLRDFLTHRTGLPAHSWLWSTNTHLSREAAVARMPHLPSVAPMRTTWRYANLGYVMVARAVENVAGVPWERFVETRVFAPLRMDRTTFSRAVAEADPNHAGGSMWREGRDVATPMQGTTPLTNSAGGIYSTANNLVNWMLLHLGEGKFEGQQLIKESTLAEMHRPQMITNRPVPTPQVTSSAYGLGWYVESYRGEKLVEHGGNHWGVSSVIGLLPDRKLGVSIFANQDGDFPSYLMFSILDRFTGGKSRDWVGEMLAQNTAAQEQRAQEASRKAKPSGDAPMTHPLADYVGTYVHPGYGTITVRLGSANQLVAQVNDDVSPLVRFRHETYVPTATEFGNIWAMVEDLKLQFLEDYETKISGLRITATIEGAVFQKQ